jgi:arabinofuranosyltransferase
LSILFSLITFWLVVFPLAIDFWSGILAGTALILSKAYVDYSTSGLENPLSHLLLVGGLLLGFYSFNDRQRSKYSTFALILLSAIYLSRPDLVLLVLPFALLLVYRSFQTVRSTAIDVALALTPILLWTCFSLIYYGFPVPNTAYAKLETGISTAESIRQGIAYLAQSLAVDPITLIFTIAGIALALFGTLELKAIAVGIVSYLVYVVIIGGDFMSGRFLTAPFLASAVILARSECDLIGNLSIGVMIAFLGSFSMHATLLSNRFYLNRDMTWSGITDERGFMFQGGGLISASDRSFTEPRWVPAKMTVRDSCGLLGGAGLSAGPGVHFVDVCGLADPLLARLPAKSDPNWRIGHFARAVPSGYTESLLTNKNLLVDPTTKNYWEIIRKVTRGPLFNADRLIAIAQLNLGLVEKPDSNMYKTGKLAPVVANIGDLTNRSDNNLPWNSSLSKLFESSIEIQLPSPTPISSIELSLAHAEKFSIEYQTQRGYQPLLEFDDKSPATVVSRRFRLDQPTPPTSRLRIEVLGGEGPFALGYLSVNG